jgi:hypothetical protein
MTIDAQTPYSSTVANGITTEFPFPFACMAAADLEVTLDGVVVASGFTITGVGVRSGGTVTFDSPPAANTVVELQLKISPERATDYQQFGDWSSDTLDDDFDRLWSAVNSMKQSIATAIKFPFTTPGDQTLAWAADDRSNKVVGTDLSGDLHMLDAETGTSLIDLGGNSGANLIGFLQAVTGAVKVSVEDKLQEFISVKDFGALGDGVTDDTTAMDAVSGVAFLIPSGTYSYVPTVGVNVTVDSFICIGGDVVVESGTYANGNYGGYQITKEGGIGFGYIYDGNSQFTFQTGSPKTAFPISIYAEGTKAFANHLIDGCGHAIEGKGSTLSCIFGNSFARHNGVGHGADATQYDTYCSSVFGNVSYNTCDSHYYTAMTDSVAMVGNVAKHGVNGGLIDVNCSSNTSVVGNVGTENYNVGVWVTSWGIDGTQGWNNSNTLVAGNVLTNNQHSADLNAGNSVHAEVCIGHYYDYTDTTLEPPLNTGILGNLITLDNSGVEYNRAVFTHKNAIQSGIIGNMISGQTNQSDLNTNKVLLEGGGEATAYVGNVAMMTDNASPYSYIPAHLYYSQAPAVVGNANNNFSVYAYNVGVRLDPNTVGFPDDMGSVDGFYPYRIIRPLPNTSAIRLLEFEYPGGNFYEEIIVTLAGSGDSGFSKSRFVVHGSSGGVTVDVNGTVIASAGKVPSITGSTSGNKFTVSAQANATGDNNANFAMVFECITPRGWPSKIKPIFAA